MFKLDEDQWEKLDAFKMAVEQEYRESHGLKPDEEIYLCAIGGGTTYSFTPTSIGISVKVTYLGREIDLTDYDLW